MAGSAVIGSLRVDLGINSAQFQNGLKSAQSGLAKFGAAAKTGLIAVGAAGAAAAGAIGVAVKGTIDAADEMSKAAAKIGIPIEELSRLKYAADLSGVSFGGLQTAVGKLSKVMNDANNGSKAAAAAFEQVGVSATNADGSLKSSSQVLVELSDKFAKLPDGAEKTALAMQLMGRSGADMIPLLNGGSEALQKLMNEADTFGQVFTAEMGTNAEAFNDNISRLQGAFGNLAAKIAQELLPYLKQFTDWLVTNAPAITQFAVQTVEGFASIGRAIGSTIEFFNQIDASLRKFGDDLRASVATAQQFATDLVAAFAAIPAQMAQIGADIVSGLWNGLRSKWDSVTGWVSGAASSIGSTFRRVTDTHSPSRVMHAIGVDIMQGLNNGMQSVDVRSGVIDTADSIQSAFQGIGSSIGEALAGTKKWSDVLKDVLNQVVQIALSGFGGGGFGGGGGGFGGIISSLFGGLFGFARGGTILPGGGGGIDSQLVAFRKSPNERVDITKPGQTLTGGGQDVRVIVGVDPKNGTIAPYVDSRIEQASPQIVATSVNAANKQVVPTMAKYQSQKAGSEWR